MLSRLCLSRLAANGPLLGERRVCMFAKSGDGSTPPPLPGTSGGPAPEETNRTERDEAPNNDAGVNDEATKRMREEGHARMRSLLGHEAPVPPDSLLPRSNSHPEESDEKKGDVQPESTASERVQRETGETRMDISHALERQEIYPDMWNEATGQWESTDPLRQTAAGGGGGRGGGRGSGGSPPPNGPGNNNNNDDNRERERQIRLARQIIRAIQLMTPEARVHLRNLLAPTIIGGAPATSTDGYVADILSLDVELQRAIFAILERLIRQDRQEERRNAHADQQEAPPPEPGPTVAQLIEEMHRRFEAAERRREAAEQQRRAEAEAAEQQRRAEAEAAEQQRRAEAEAAEQQRRAEAEAKKQAEEAEKKHIAEEAALADAERDRKKKAAEKVFNLRETRDRVEKTRTGMNGNIQRLEALKAIIELKVKDKEEQKEHLYVLDSNLKFLREGMGTMDSWGRLLETMNSWEGGNMNPVSFVTDVQRYLHPNVTTEEKEQFVVECMENLCKDAPEIGKTQRQDGKFDYGTNWDTLDVSHKILIANGASNDVKKFMNGYLDKLDPQFRKLKEYSASIEGLAKTEGGEFQFGIAFYSVNEVIASVKNVVEAFKTAGKEWTQLRVAGLSAQLGNLTKHLPFGDSAQQTLSASLNHKDDEVKDHYTKHLESDIVPFYEMIPSHHGAGLLERNKNDGNRFRGSLDYMAKKGWIYDIDIINKTVMGHKLIAGKTVPATWTDVNITEYLIHLDGANKSGQSAEKKRGYDRVDRVASIAPGIEILKHEIADGNYWAVLGIMNRLLEKAKDGETACWIATSIMNMLRTDHTARRYFPLELLDRLGNEGLVHLANTNINFVIDRWDIRHWADDHMGKGKNKEASDKLEESGNLGKVMKGIEEEIYKIEEDSRVPHLTGAQLERVVARVMASQVVKEPGWSRGLTIFNKKFYQYRKNLREGGEGKAVDPSKTDDDFFNSDSEMVMHGPNIVSRILAVRSPAHLTYEEKGLSFMAQLLRRAKQLKKNAPPEDLLAFQNETKETFKFIFSVTWNVDAIAKPFIELTHSEGEGLPLLYALLKAGLIDESHIRSLKGKTKLADSFLEQIDNLSPKRRTPATPPPPPATPPNP